MSELPWVEYLLKLQSEGFKEIPGPTSNPKILEWSKVAAKYPYMTDDSTTPWCGIGLAGVFYDLGMQDAIPKDSAAAISWLNCGPPCEPKRGAVVVFPRPGGNHVAVLLAVKGELLECIGCNQNNAITTTNFYAHSAKGYRWPKGANMPAETSSVTSNYKDLLQRCQVKTAWQSHIDSYAAKIVDNKDQYKEIERATGVPWAVIGAIHYRESTLDFKTHLHNGDSLKARTINVPAGRPKDGSPPFTWVDSAIDALVYEDLDKVTDWSMENICNVLEAYNGLGYRRMGIPSPYLWSGTNNYVRGKYTSDGSFNGSVVDKQAGTIPLYLRAMELANESNIRDNSRKISIIDKSVNGVKALVAVVGGLFTADSMGVFKDWFRMFNGIIDGKTIVIVFGGGAIVWVIFRWLDKLMMEDAKAGTWIPSGLSEPVIMPPETLAPVGVNPNVEQPVKLD